MAQAFMQTARLFRFSIKKDWGKISLWLLGSAFFIFGGLFEIVQLFGGDPAERETLALVFQNPGMIALFGRALGEQNFTNGAIFTQVMTIMTFILTGIMSILLVVRNTRSEEEDGILELIQAQPVGRVAHTAAAILLLVTTNILVLIISVVILMALKDSSMMLEGVLLTGTIYATSGIFFGAVTLVTAQLSTNARGAMMLAFGVLGVSYIIRIIGDVSLSFLSWFSPMGLLYNTEPFVKNDWYPVFISLGTSLLLIALALFLKQKRDMGSGLLPDKEGERHASAVLKTPVGFALNLIKTPLIVWTVALIILGVTYGSVIGDLDSLLEGNEILNQIIAAEEGVSISQQFLAMILGVLAFISSIPALQFLYRLRTEEVKGRLNNVFAGTHSRYVILGTFFLLSVCVALVLQLLASLAFGGAAVAMDFNVEFIDVLLAAMAYVPAVYILIGMGTLFLGWLPKLTAIVWVYLVFIFINLYFGELFNFPDWLRNLSAFQYVPEIPVEEWSWPVALSLTGAALAFSAIGFIGYRKRDID
ncbi:ABC-2 type transport system permease protein [Alkalibacterium subtropicum]|uniref:ABC-2 type transport system permease protein n=1 Tax=Alkalibacterium subtropicum TaxID=753702 RepID=A0A1I1KCB4_9LACT|nr:hypothetical protein [Alkalibacterium subtropicum]SFC57932.1 ABC-2 type transport system permease protein [Alkalibacterium subtropicum]